MSEVELGLAMSDSSPNSRIRRWIASVARAAIRAVIVVAILVLVNGEIALANFAHRQADTVRRTGMTEPIEVPRLFTNTFDEEVLQFSIEFPVFAAQVVPLGVEPLRDPLGACVDGWTASLLGRSGSAAYVIIREPTAAQGNQRQWRVLRLPETQYGVVLGVEKPSAC